MSDILAGAGWWEASDGKWYPPELHPSAGERADGSGTVAGDEPQPVPSALGPEPYPSTSLSFTKRRRRIGRPGLLAVGALVASLVVAGSAFGITQASKSAPPSAGNRRAVAPADGPASSPESSVAATPPSTNSSAAPSSASSNPPSPGAASDDPAPSTAIGPPGSPVTQAVGNQVLATTWVGYSQAMVANDRSALARYTTPSALEDSEATLGCGCLAGPMSYTSAFFDVPQQHGYPLSFLAGLTGTSYSQQVLSRYVVFRKASSSAPWLISFTAAFLAGGGFANYTPYATEPPPAVPYPIAGAPQAFADFFQQLDTTGDEGSGAPANWAHDDHLDTDVANSLQIDQERKAQGWTQQFTHSIDDVSPLFTQDISGAPYGEMECFALHVTDVITGSSSSPIVQPDDLSVFGDQLAAGTYSQVTHTEEVDECIGEATTSGITLLTESGGDYQFSAVPSATASSS